MLMRVGTVGSSIFELQVVHARWNTLIVDALVEGFGYSTQAGVREENITIQSVPGSYELPFASDRRLAF